jgi:hypothetical protein
MSGKVSLFREMDTKYITRASFIATTQPATNPSEKMTISNVVIPEAVKKNRFVIDFLKTDNKCAFF